MAAWLDGYTLRFDPPICFSADAPFFDQFYANCIASSAAPRTAPTIASYQSYFNTGSRVSHDLTTSYIA
jgi:hypothetical protein